MEEDSDLDIIEREKPYSLQKFKDLAENFQINHLNEVIDDVPLIEKLSKRIMYQYNLSVMGHLSLKNMQRNFPEFFEEKGIIILRRFIEKMLL